MKLATLILILALPVPMDKWLKPLCELEGGQYVITDSELCVFPLPGMIG